MIINSKCERCRAAGEKLFLRGERCFSPKCAFLRRPTKPGKSPQQARRRRQVSEYGRQLIEKQKAKLTYGITEKQMRLYFKEARRKKGSTSEVLFQILERRLDNVVFRLGLARSKGEARQLTSHGHFSVNGRRSKIPSRLLKVGDKITIRQGSTGKSVFGDLAERIKKQRFPGFLSLDLKTMEGNVIGEPSLIELKPSFDPALIVEFYSLLKVK